MRTKHPYHKLLSTKKIAVIITDLDNTLWNGILAEKQKLRLCKEYYKFLLQLQKKGVQLIVVSKNDQSAVDSAFQRLKIDKNAFTAVIANWDAKYLNIEKIITHTGFRPETVVFIDDNPLERVEVQTKIPLIYAVDARDWRILTEHPYLKKRKEQTLYERNTRMNRYRTALRMKSMQYQHPDDPTYLKKLKRKISVGGVDPDNLDRFARLFIETHRINFNPEKFQNYEQMLDYLHDRLNRGDLLYAISTQEGGYDLGLTGALVVRLNKKRARITDGTYSCGIIGRDFEQKSLLVVIEKLIHLGMTYLDVDVTLTGTNVRVRECLSELNFKETKKNKQAVYSLSLPNYKPPKSYSWVEVLTTSPQFDYMGHPAVIVFFENYVRPRIQKGWRMANLGSSKGEVLGLLQEDARHKFYVFLRSKKVHYVKIDKEYYPDEKNSVGDAEDLSTLLHNNSQNLVMAVELLEHTEHFWRVINEMIRVCKIGGYIFITCPSYNYPKHEYPIDLWRIGLKTLCLFFPKPFFTIIHKEAEGDTKTPRRSLILVKKNKVYTQKFYLPKNGKTNWNTGLTIFP